MLNTILRKIGYRPPTWGDYTHLDSARETPRYEAIERLRCEFAPHADLLDLGCGQGLVAEHLTTRTRYVGVDLMPNAIAAAQPSVYARFRCHDIAERGWIGDQHFGCILFNEVLYYQPSPAHAVRLMKNYAAHATDDGIFIVSICINAMAPDRPNGPTWAAVLNAFAPRVIAQDTVRCDDVTHWQIAVIRPH